MPAASKIVSSTFILQVLARMTLSRKPVIDSGQCLMSQELSRAVYKFEIEARPRLYRTRI
jgi:hypothetical protein